MGADGGYRYIQKDKLLGKRGLSEADVDLWWKYVRHAVSFEVREELVDVDEWERENMHGEFGVNWFRLPDGTDFDGKLGDVWKDEDYSNPPEELWYYRTWLEENLWQYSSGCYYWWTDPRSWYVWGHRDEKDERGWFKPLVTIPTPDEIDELVRITEWFEAHHPVTYLETWT
jgi:hypothetical protein